MPTTIDIDRILKEEKELFLRKLHDYGTEDMTEAGVPGVIARMNEKLLRLKNLMKQADGIGGRAMEEPIRDTFLDLMGYALIGTLLHDGIWERTEGISFKPETPEPTSTPSVAKEALRVVHLDGEQSPLHKPKMDGDVGHDLEIQKDTWVLPTWLRAGKAQTIPCGVRMKIPQGLFCQIMGRSSSANKKGLLVHTAVIDENYTGKMFACTFNLSLFPKKVKKGERLAQVVFFKAHMPEIIKVDELPITTRGEKGFGSTGK